MKAFVALCCVFSVAHASIIPLFYTLPSVSHYHSQDTLGQYSYGYSGGPSAKHELKTIDGVTFGGYSYIDANNVLQSASYVADPINGFRVAATNIPEPVKAPEAPKAPEPVALEIPVGPQETPEVAAARAEHLAAHAAAASGEHSRKRRSLFYAAPIPLTYSAYTAPFHYAPVPYTQLHYAPVISTQHVTQDTLGQYNYGYHDGLSSTAETRAFDGTTVGGYSYLDPNGVVQNVQYTADALGFRVAASNLPVAPKPIESAPLEAPVPVTETPEVAAATAEHLAAVEKAKAEVKEEDKEEKVEETKTDEE